MRKYLKQKRLTLYSSEYQDFLKSSLEYKKRLIKWMRNGVSFVIVILMILLFSIVNTNIYEKIAYPVLLFINFVFTSLLLKKRFEKYCSLYLCLLILIFEEFGIELGFSLHVTSDVGVILGFEVGLFFSVFLVSKLPFYYILVSSTVISIHLIYRLFRVVEAEIPMVTAGIIVLIFLVLNILYYRQESLEFEIWRDLQRSLKSMQCFQALIQEFPSEIVIISQKSWASDSILYMNKEAEKKMAEMQNETSINRFLGRFSLERNLEQSPHAHLQRNLPFFINEFFQEENTIPLKFYNEIGTLHLKEKENIELERSNSKEENFSPTKFDSKGKFFTEAMRENKVNLIEESESAKLLKADKVEENNSTKKIKYEIKTGNIKWNAEDALILILTDISSTEKIRELYALHENKDKLLATVSHELRTPLNGIIGMLDIVDEKTEGLDPELKYYISIARNSAKTLLLMINDILDISQIQKGKLRLNITESPIQNLIEEVLPLVEVQIKKKGLDLIYENSVAKGTSVRVDPMRFQQILLNLLSNACKFTHAGNIKIKIEEKEYENEPDGPLDSCIGTEKSVMISVSDTGRGIKEENIQGLFKLFGKFEQAGNPTGVGLGLAISQKLAKQMHPSGISVSSVYGKGTSFWFFVYQVMKKESLERNTFPTGKTYVELNTLSSISACKPASNKLLLNSKLILVVDDDQISQIVLSKYLASAGSFSVFKAYNGLQAIQIIDQQAEKQQFFDLIFMDCNMPIMDGFEATRIIRENIKKDKLPDLKIIALTANVSAADKKHCLESGMNDVWNKPLEKKEFIKLIADYLT